MDESSFWEPSESGSPVVIIGHTGISRISEPAAQHQRVSLPRTYPPHTHTQTHSLRVPFLASVQKTPGGLVERANWKSLDMVVPGGGERAHLLGAFIDVLRSVEVWRRASQCPTRVGFLLGMKSNSQMNTVSHLVSRHVQLPWIPRMGLCPDARAGDSRDNNGRGGFRG